ncbi:MAG: SpoIIE family protein phosphatase [Alphaproteobacteria bacterium]
MGPVNRGQTRALVIEDQTPVRRFIAACLEAAGYHVVTATDGLEGWDILERDGTSFDVILLDRRMPGLDGMDVLARIMADPRLGGIPVILETAADSQSEIAEGLSAGAYYYLTKPIDREVLITLAAAAVEDGMRYRRLHADLGRLEASLGLMASATFRFRTVEEANALAVTLAQACPRPATRLVGLSELLTNAVEHGNLAIDYQEKDRLIAEGRWDEVVTTRLALPENRGKVVTVDFRRRPGRIEITIRDQGNGFDWESYLVLDPRRALATHGRGIALARAVSFDGLAYRGRGNEVMAVIQTPDGPEVPEDAAQSRIEALEAEIARLNKEIECDGMEIARSMQSDLFPDTEAQTTIAERYGVALSAHVETCSRLGGDLWGGHAVDNNRFALYVADFSGHGVTAALSAFRLDTLLREIVRVIKDPGECLSALNYSLAGMLPTGQYATMLFGLVDLAAGSFVYAGAGAPHPIVVDTATAAVTFGNGAGLPLGIDRKTRYVERRMAFPAGSLLFLHSDCLAECGRVQGKALGRAGVVNLLETRMRAASPGTTVNARYLLAPFLETVPQPLSDDLTVVCCVRPGA